MSAKKPAATAFLRILVPAGKASPSPPVGPALGQRGIKSMDFCKQFNDRTKDIEPGTPIPTVITVKPDRTFSFVTKSPPTSWLLKRAAGVEKGSSQPGSQIVGKISLKHVYEIATRKHKDANLAHQELKNICGSIVGTARSVGIEVIP
ncbi:mitochondrial 54S ribosomal protein YmL19 [Basidiobolus ranarum]|uniref:Mitochondrial 54S ribosomal protein YmL19 n=1 Tax=Basidiobolus ranarum TaxID=34480 RepID=A0ABR2W2C0_9FUNG